MTGHEFLDGGANQCLQTCSPHVRLLQYKTQFSANVQHKRNVPNCLLTSESPEVECETGFGSPPAAYDQQNRPGT